MNVDLTKVQKVLVVNGHGCYAGFSEGGLNGSIVQLVADWFRNAGKEVRVSVVDSDYDIQEEVEKVAWADFIFFQSPVFWMGTPWQFKKWIDEVYTGGVGTLYKSDGRHSATPQDGYGTGGLLDSYYMLSLTFNAPKGAFNRPDQFLFEGRSVDDLWVPFHKTQSFVGIKQVPDSTFIFHDVLKNPTIEQDMKRLTAQLEALFGEQATQPQQEGAQDGEVQEDVQA